MNNDEYEVFFEETFLNLNSELKTVSHSIYLKPNIPSKKLAGAIGNYAKGIAPEEVLVLIDDTLFGGAKEGMLITPYEMMGKEKFEDAICISHDEIEDIVFPKKHKLHINGVLHFTFTQPDNNALISLMKNLQMTIAKLNEALSENVEHENNGITELNDELISEHESEHPEQNPTITTTNDDTQKDNVTDSVDLRSQQSNEYIDENRLAKESTISSTTDNNVKAIEVDDRSNLKLRVFSSDSLYPAIKSSYHLEQVNSGISMYLGESSSPYKAFGEILVKACHKAVVKFRDIIVVKAECEEMANNAATIEVLCHFVSIAIIKLQNEGVSSKFIEQVLVNNIYAAFLMKPTDRNSEMWANIMKVVTAYISAYEKSGDCINMELFIIRLVGCNLLGKFDTDLQKIIAVTYPNGKAAGEEMSYIATKYDASFYKYNKWIESEMNSLVDNAFRILNNSNTPEKSTPQWD